MEPDTMDHHMQQLFDKHQQQQQHYMATSSLITSGCAASMYNSPSAARHRTLLAYSGSRDTHTPFGCEPMVVGGVYGQMTPQVLPCGCATYVTRSEVGGYKTATVLRKERGDLIGCGGGGGEDGTLPPPPPPVARSLSLNHHNRARAHVQQPSAAHQYQQFSTFKRFKGGDSSLPDGDGVTGQAAAAGTHVCADNNCSACAVTSLQTDDVAKVVMVTRDGTLIS